MLRRRVFESLNCVISERSQDINNKPQVKIKVYVQEKQPINTKVNVVEDGVDSLYSLDVDPLESRRSIVEGTAQTGAALFCFESGFFVKPNVRPCGAWAGIGYGILELRFDDPVMGFGYMSFELDFLHDLKLVLEAALIVLIRSNFPLSSSCFLHDIFSQMVGPGGGTVSFWKLDLKILPVQVRVRPASFTALAGTSAGQTNFSIFIEQTQGIWLRARLILINDVVADVAGQVLRGSPSTCTSESHSPDVLTRQHENRLIGIRLSLTKFFRYKVKKEPLEAWILREFTGSETDEDLIMRARGFIFLILGGHMLSDMSDRHVELDPRAPLDAMWCTLCNLNQLPTLFGHNQPIPTAFNTRLELQFRGNDHTYWVTEHATHVEMITLDGVGISCESTSTIQHIVILGLLDSNHLGSTDR
ncbi:hypothetical protein M9H77_31393 [Catharanthus roseus]|uniref:Uncharacterized protein n=1 Tax=Catharanthus roseus TaxID=4058 RepID=A0ACC0A0C2_CATRO|nr:hypothetical protein M9H77_31393 [Catharanthus roseus]